MLIFCCRDRAQKAKVFDVVGAAAGRVRVFSVCMLTDELCARDVHSLPLEQENLKKLADAKAEFVTEQFGRIEESVLQLQAFAEQALLAAPETLVVDSYVASVWALELGLPAADEASFDYSVW